MRVRNSIFDLRFGAKEFKAEDYVRNLPSTWRSSGRRCYRLATDTSDDHAKSINKIPAAAPGGVRIAKFRIRVIPRILTKDPQPRPQKYDILDPLSIRVRDPYCPV